MSVVILTFLSFIAAFAVIGMFAIRARRSTTNDYLVAGRSVSPWLTGLSSAATNNSGFMFIGLLGFTYRFGVQAIWLQTGWIVGDLIAWLWVHRRVRSLSETHEASSVPTLLATDRAGTIARPIAVAAGTLTFLFLAGYAAAQLKAGSTALTALFGWAPEIGILLGIVIVVAYCFSGGLRASIWTDAAQAFVMIGSLGALLVYAMLEVGGLGTLWSSLERADPSLVEWFPDGLAFGFALYALGFVFGGLGAIGQPHILIRSMAIQSSEDIPRARNVYFAWFVPFSAAAVLVGLYGRVLLPDLLVGVAPEHAGVAAEASLPSLGVLLLPEVLLGALLAGVFAATMSTADSQILSCSAAITQDIAPRYKESYTASKMATLAVAALALAIALTAPQSVFALVLGAWSALGASLGPLLIVRLLGWPLPPLRAYVMMATGIVTTFLWGRSAYAADIFELLPGMAVPSLIYLAAMFADRARGIVRT